MSESMREEFEAWAIKQAEIMRYSFPPNSVELNGLGDYAIVWVQGAWLGWQASRAALCVELPKRAAYEQLDSAGVFVCLSYELNPESMGDTVELARISDVIEAIHAAGVKTK